MRERTKIMDIIVATNNQGKVKEIKNILYPHNVMSQMEIGVDIDVEETGLTFVENAFLKARALKPYTDCAIIADDSGLMVDYLNGDPGVFSARYAGENTTPMQGIEKLLKNLDGVPFEGRGAKFVSVIALILPDGSEYSFEGECSGYITNILKGENGFGFDPVFYYPPFDKTFAELTDDEKNSVSHRSVAIAKLSEFLEKL